MFTLRVKKIQRVRNRVDAQNRLKICLHRRQYFYRSKEMQMTSSWSMCSQFPKAMVVTALKRTGILKIKQIMERHKTEDDHNLEIHF